MRHCHRVKKRDTAGGFTLIELLVVISIIGILSSVITATLRGVRVGSRESYRVQQVKEMEKAIELYYADNGHYPWAYDGQTFGQQYTHGECVMSDGNEWIKGLAPEYIKTMPSDPTLDCSEGSVTHSWVYQTDGYDYKLITHGESPEEPKAAGLVDPVWDSGVDPCLVDGPDAFHYGVWSSGATCWEQ